MNVVNPKFILKNYILNDAISEAKNGNYQMVNDFFLSQKHHFKN